MSYHSSGARKSLGFNNNLIKRLTLVAVSNAQGQVANGAMALIRQPDRNFSREQFGADDAPLFTPPARDKIPDEVRAILVALR